MVPRKGFSQTNTESNISRHYSYKRLDYLQRLTNWRKLRLIGMQSFQYRKQELGNSNIKMQEMPTKITKHHLHHTDLKTHTTMLGDAVA